MPQFKEVHMFKTKFSFLLLALAFSSTQAMAASQIYSCKNDEGVIELVIGAQKNHLKVISQDPPLKKNESATWASNGNAIFLGAKAVSNFRTIEMGTEKTSNTTLKLHIGYDLDPACPSCESGHYTNNSFNCELVKSAEVDAKKYFEYKREAHYPTGKDFQWTMREVAEDFWGPRTQVTLVDPKTQTHLVINFDDRDQIWLHGWTKNSGPNSFMEEMIRMYLEKKPIILEEGSNSAGKCQFEALLKHNFPSAQCKRLSKGQ